MSGFRDEYTIVLQPDTAGHAGATSGIVTKESVGARLLKLKGMLDRGEISEEQYRADRERLLAER